MIKTIQRRMTTIGRIRIGDSVPTVSKRTGKEFRRPRKLDLFRLTSTDRLLLEHAAKEYGGQVQRWEPKGKPREWELYTEVERLPIVVPPQGSVTQWFEHWEGRRCARRCDGVVETLSGQGCLCAAGVQPDCKPTTRLNVFLKDLPGAGQWLLTSHGFNAAAELPGYADLLGAVGGYVDADLRIEERTSVVDGESVNFMVPVISVMATPAELLSGRGTIQLGSPYRVRPVAELEAEAVDVTPSTMAQRQRMGRLMKVQGMGADQAQEFVCGIVGRQMESSEELTEAEAEMVLKALAVLPTPHQVWEQLVEDVLPVDWSTVEAEQAFARDHGGSMPAECSVAHIRAWGELLGNGLVDRA